LVQPNLSRTRSVPSLLPSHSAQYHMFADDTQSYSYCRIPETEARGDESRCGCSLSSTSRSITFEMVVRLDIGRRTSLALSCLLRPTRMYANFAPPRLDPLPSNEAGRSSEGAPSQWPAPTYGTISPRPSVLSTSTQPSVVPLRHISSAWHLTLTISLFYHDIDVVMHNRSFDVMCDVM